MNVMSERQIEKIINLMQTDDSADAPKDAIRWAKNIFLTRAAAPKKSVLRKVLAVLQVDLSPNKAAFGERSASASQVRQMLFQAGENALDIRIAETENGFRINGQILGEGFANAVVAIGEFKARTNEESEFRLNEVPAGIYEIRLQTDDQEIVIENLELKS